ncbi:MAG: AEC family transporter [Pseudomonadota bacterium]
MSTEIFQIVAPVFVVVGIGFFLEWRGMGFHAESLSRLAMLLGTPALVFSSLTGTALPDDSLARIVAIAVSAVLVGGGIAFLILTAFRLPRTTFLAPLSLPNAGNAGLPIVFFAFADDGLAIGAAYFFTIALVQYTVVPALVSGELDLKKLLREPLIWSIVAVLLFRISDVAPPGIVMDTTELLGAMMIPVMLILLGGALARLRVRDIGTSAALAFLRLAIGLSAGLSLLWLFDLSGVEAGAIFLLTAMPSALVTYVIAEHYGKDAERVAGLVVSSTVLNFMLLPGLIAAALYFAAA